MIGDYLGDLLQAGDLRQQLAADFRVPLERQRLDGRELVALVDLGQSFLGNGDAADLGEHCRDLDRPRLLQFEFPRQLAHQVVHPGSPAKRGRIHQSQDVGEHLHHAGESAGEKLAFGGDQAILLNSRLQGLGELLGRTGLGHESEDVAVVDRVQGGLLIAVAGQHHPDGIRGDLVDFRQQPDPVESGHPHVGNHHRIRPLVDHRRQGLFAIQRRLDIETFAQRAVVGVEKVGVIIDTQDSFGH